MLNKYCAKIAIYSDITFKHTVLLVCPAIAGPAEAPATTRVPAVALIVIVAIVAIVLFSIVLVATFSGPPETAVEVLVVVVLAVAVLVAVLFVVLFTSSFL